VTVEQVLVPAWVMAKLGGMVAEDPPILVQGVVGPVLMHPAEHVELMEGDRLVLPVSSPALLRVLGRHVDAAPFPGGECILQAVAPGYPKDVETLEWALGVWPRCHGFGIHRTPPRWSCQDRGLERPPYTRVGTLLGIPPDRRDVALAAIAIHLAAAIVPQVSRAQGGQGRP
jgi:hypothetical protein